MLEHLIAARSDFSLGESLLQVDAMVSRAKELGYKSVALVDTMSIHAMVEFTNKCDKAGIKPIVGCTLRVYDDATYRKPKKADLDAGAVVKDNREFRVKVFVRTQTGMQWLLRTLSKASSEERFYYNARCELSDFDDAEGISLSTGDMYGLFSHPDPVAILGLLYEKIGREHVFLELSPVDTPLFDRLNALAIDCVDSESNFVVSYPVFYSTEAQAQSLDVLKAISTKGDTHAWAPKQFVKDFYMQEPSHLVARIKAAAQRQAKWEDNRVTDVWGKAIRGLDRLADSVEYKFKKMAVSLPVMAEDEFAELKRQCQVGWKNRFSKPVLGHKPDMSDPAIKAKYLDRLKTELGVLQKMGFSNYFLLAADITGWSKANDIIVGPGRGSVGGSLVAYLVGITDVDPIRFDLLFERFINPERLDLPDADLDFMSSRRHEVIDYLRGKYGIDRVANISNFASLASASAIRDTGRVHGLHPFDMSATKLVPKEHGQPVSLTVAAEQVAEIDRFRGDFPDIWQHALNLEGVMRGMSMHAGGVVVAGEPLTQRAVVETRGDTPVIAWDKRTVEDWGLVKLDILGLSTLDVLGHAKTYIKERHGIDINYLDISLDDAAVYEALGRGDTTGVFQLESGGMRKLLRDLAVTGPLKFEDISAITALYRPGPMDSGLMADFVAIRQGKQEPYYDHPVMEKSLGETKSVIVYQEQVMQLSIDLAGFTRAGADHLRKAMGKKDKDKMAEMRQKWIDGCKVTVGMDANASGALFDKIEAFAGYGFNKSHSVEYSVLSFWTMWLRVKYPAEYFAASLTIVAEEKLAGLVKDARECGIAIVPPMINKSTNKYLILDDKTIVAPFGAMLGASEATALNIMRLRNEAGGEFTSVEDFKARAGAPKSGVNKRVIERLDSVGAFAALDPSDLPANHIDRRKVQTELLPGLIIDSIKSDRVTNMSAGYLRARVISIAQEFKTCSDCSLANNPHPMIRIPKTTMRFMVVSDSPSWQEEKEDKLLTGDAASFLKAAITANELAVSEGYYTTLVKSKKTDKFLTNEQINGCVRHLNAEIEVLKPAVIVALGSAAIKHFLPDEKGGTNEMAGKAFYNPTLDASIVCGINPQQCAFDPSKAELLVKTFAKVAEITL